MKWRKPSEDLIIHLDESLKDFNCEKRKMFGCPCIFINKNLFAGVHMESIMLRLSEEDRKKLLSEFDEAVHFEPMEGRPMKDYMVLPDSVYNNNELFQVWLDKSYRYAVFLPPKRKRKKRKSK